MNCALRRIHNHTVWYLHSCELGINKAVWTRRYIKAHQFQDEEDAMDFARVFLGERLEECDTFSEYETWSI